MNLPFEIARRYLFGRKSTNAINLITGISVFGLSIGTAALILILSVFNGFESLLSGLLNDFNPDIKVTPLEGKFFELDSSQYSGLTRIKGIEQVSKTIEEIAFFEYNNVQEVGKLKGVDDYFSKVTSVDSTIRKGEFVLRERGVNYGVLGMGLSNKLGVNLNDVITPIKVYMPLRKKKGPLGKDFKYMTLQPAGAFSVQSDNDFRFLICSIEFANKLLDRTSSISAIEIKMTEDADEQEIRQGLTDLLGDQFLIKNRYEQDEAFLKIMNIEKWVSYLIVSLMLLIIAFNLIGALWMIVLDKKEDIGILRALGFTGEKIRQLFLLEGVLMCLLGLGTGIVFALILYFAQKHLGLISIPEGFIISAYPIEIKLSDFVVVSITVLILGFMASILPARRAAKMESFVKNQI